ncbi:membrane metallo-endopeptidase-like 1 [Dermacentor variabilis]|uniref:membrane metallo-endopeptidase-like 1 n=1 Tax=Dermacentor variabilis TaxID=34621 RepID=UPI003F5AFAF1
MSQGTVSEDALRRKNKPQRGRRLSAARLPATTSVSRTELVPDSRADVRPTESLKRAADVSLSQEPASDTAKQEPANARPEKLRRPSKGGSETDSRQSRRSKSSSGIQGRAIKPSSQPEAFSGTSSVATAAPVPVKECDTVVSPAPSSEANRPSRTALRDANDHFSRHDARKGSRARPTHREMSSASGLHAGLDTPQPPPEDGSMGQGQPPESVRIVPASTPDSKTSAKTAAPAQPRPGLPGLSVSQRPSNQEASAPSRLKPISPTSAPTISLHDTLAVTNPDPSIASLVGLQGKTEGSQSKSRTVLSPRLLALAAILRSTRSTTSGYGHFFGRAPFAVFASLALIVTVVVAIALLLMATNQRTFKDLCITEDCHVHAALLHNVLNESIDACEDFRAHVCSKWSPPGDRKQLRDFDTSVMEDMVFSWLFGLEETLQEGSKKFPVGHKALLMFQSCMSGSSEYGSTMNEFRLFIQQLGLSWPEQPTQQIDALEVLLTLAYDWHIEFWFTVQILKYGLGTRDFWRLSLEPAPQLPFYLQHHRSVINSGGYYEYWSQFYTAFTSTIPIDSVRRATEAARLEGDILEALNQALHASPREAATFPLGEMEAYTRSVQSVRWIKRLQNVTDLKPALKQQDDVVVSNVKFLFTVGEVFGNYSNLQILEFLSWQFVEHYGPVADSRLLLTRYGDQTIADTLRPAFCAFHIEVAYKAVLLSMQFALRITKEHRLQIYRGFRRLRLKAVHFVNSSEWLDSKSKDSVAAKLNTLELAVWPPAEYLTNESLEEIFKTYPEHEKTFGSYWIKSIRSLRTAKKDSAYKYVLGLPLNYAQPYFVYDYFMNSVRVAIGAVSRPLYYSEGTRAMFYGGIGFSFAFELVKALDREGLRWSRHGGVVTSIISANSKAAFDERDNCLSNSEERDHSLFPEIPALEIAYSAFVDATKEAEKELSMSADFSETQVFFLTMCYMTCSLKGVVHPFSANCNKLVRNSLAFASAFSCPLGSKMNPLKKCTLFG